MTFTHPRRECTSLTLPSLLKGEKNAPAFRVDLIRHDVADLQPEHPRALGRGRRDDSEQAEHGDYDARAAFGHGCALRYARIAYWITSSARPSSDGGIVRPSALAVLRLITSSNFVGCSTGRSPGLAPLRILST